MKSLKFTFGFLILTALSVHSGNSQYMSDAKTLTDLTNQLLKIINDNKKMTANDIMPLLISQARAAIESMKKAGSYPSISDIMNSVADLMSRLPKDGPIVGEIANRYQIGLTRQLSQSFPPKST